MMLRSISGLTSSSSRSQCLYSKIGISSHVRNRSRPTSRSFLRWKQFSSAVAQSEHSLHMTTNFSVTETKLEQTFEYEEVQRLSHIRNVGILAHVDAGKTTVTERMLALAGVVRAAGSVDSGNTVTDYLPAERERGITIQSAAISFDWGWHNSKVGDDYSQKDKVQIHLIDTPGHVDFSVEVNRSVAVLDGAVLVVDAVAGVQAQTETVWRAITMPSINNHTSGSGSESERNQQEPLPCLALVNKMDKEGCHFGSAIQSLRQKLPGANPISAQLPLFRISGRTQTKSNVLDDNIVAMPLTAESNYEGNTSFIGVVDLIHMRAVIWPDTPGSEVSDVENCIPTVINLVHKQDHEPVDPTCPVTQSAIQARQDFISRLAEVDEAIEEYYILDEEPTNAELRAALRRATLTRKTLPVMASAALRGKGIELLLDGIADLLPSPLDRLPPAIIQQDQSAWGKTKPRNGESSNTSRIKFGHPMHPSTLALAFKVLHMKGRGGSGDGRVVFARIYSGKISTRDVLKCITPAPPGAMPEKPRKERVGGMLELAGGRFENLGEGVCKSGDVCALVGLKTVCTGDTILLSSNAKSSNGNGKSKKKKRNGNSNSHTQQHGGNVCLAGVASPKPVLTVRVEAESSAEQARLSDALSLLSIEDPSLRVEESDSATLLSGLGELHIEVTLDRLRREFGLEVTTGSPTVAYRETITHPMETEGGLFNYDRTIGGIRMQASIHLRLEPIFSSSDPCSQILTLTDPIVTVGPRARQYLNVDPYKPEERLLQSNATIGALINGCQGSLRRGAIGPYAMSNVHCQIVDVDAEQGLSYLTKYPGALRAAAQYAIASMFASTENKAFCSILEPRMSIEIAVPGHMVGNVVSDLTGRRGAVNDVVAGDCEQSKALVRGDVPLVEILGYANGLRSLTGGEGSFTAEYKGHAPCDEFDL